jgi:hypothetical protein
MNLGGQLTLLFVTVSVVGAATDQLMPPMEKGRHILVITIALFAIATLLIWNALDGHRPHAGQSTPLFLSKHTFHGYNCTEDCSGHEAGYNWAERHELINMADCAGNSQSFIEGCRAYVLEGTDAYVRDDGIGSDYRQ